MHTGFALSGQGERVFLFDAQANRADAFSFGPQVTDLSVGRVGGYWQLTVPTPNAANQLASVGGASGLVINEWLANAAVGQSDWLELYNPSSLPVALRGLYLGTSNALFQITAVSYLPAGGYVQLLADELPGPNHLDFKLPAEGRRSCSTTRLGWSSTGSPTGRSWMGFRRVGCLMAAPP